MRTPALEIAIPSTLQDAVENIKVKVVLRFTKTDNQILQQIVDRDQARDPPNQSKPHDDMQTSSETEICLPKKYYSYRSESDTN